MSVDARAIANLILDYGDQKGIAITHLSLQKLLYFCHAWVLTRCNKPLVGQSFEAWEHGPVIQCVYAEFKHFGADPINGRAQALDRLTGRKITAQPNLTEDMARVVGEALDFYSALRPYDLVQMSHVPGGPWARVWEHKGTLNPGMYISDDAIREYFSNWSNVTKRH